MMRDEEIVNCMKRVLFLDKDELLRRVGEGYFNSLGIPNYAFQNEHVIRVMVRQTRRIMELCNARGKRVLEIGCGIGFNSIITVLAGAGKVTALDFIKPQIEVMERMVEVIDEPVLSRNLTIVCGDATRMDFPEDSFEVVEILDVLSHCQDLDELVKRIKTVSCKGRCIYVLDGNNALRLGAAKHIAEVQQMAESGPLEPAHEAGICVGITVPYVKTRADMIKQRFPELDDAVVAHLAKDTAGLYGAQIIKRVDLILSGVEAKREDPFLPDVCVIKPCYRNPENGMWPEVAFSPLKLKRYLCANGIKVDLIPYRHTVFSGGIRGFIKRVAARVVQLLYPATLWVSPGFELLGHIENLESKEEAV